MNRRMQVFILLLLPAIPASAKEKLFDSSEPLKIEFSGEFQKMKSETKYDRVVHPGYLRYDGTELKVELEARGKSRRGLCSQFPPFKLILPKGKRPEPFGGIDRDLKFVTHCKNKDENEQAYVMNEYTAYKILAAAGLPSFRVRLVDGVFKELDGRENARGTGFFIENIKDYAKRAGINADSRSESTEAEMQAKYLVSEALISNSDFLLPNSKAGTGQLHNVRLVLGKNKEVVAMVPYDFDLSNFSGKWEKADPSQVASSIKYLREHFAAGEALGLVASRREAILKAVDESPSRAEDQAWMKAYLSAFLDEAAKPAN